MDRYFVEVDSFYEDSDNDGIRECFHIGPTIFARKNVKELGEWSKAK